jgi:hypothetical protein
MLSTFLDRAQGLLNRRFLVAYWFPTLFAALLLALPRVLFYGPGNTWRWWAGLAAPENYAGEGSPQIALLVTGLLLITLVAYLLQAFTRPLVRTFEGYTWPAFLRRWIARRAARDWQALRRERREAARTEDRARYAARQDELHYAYPDRAWLLLPTRLGNVLRAAEAYPTRAYGMDAPFWWPRLWPLLPEEERAAVEDGLTSMVSLLNFTALMAYVTVDVAVYLSLCPLAYRGAWSALALGLGALLIILAYRGAVAQARGYGQRIRTAVDLHRFVLLEALHVPLPSTPLEERALWARLAAWLYNGDLGAARELDYEVEGLAQIVPGPEEGERQVSGFLAFWKRLWR